MQQFDALTIRAVLGEAKALLLNRRVDKVEQLVRDEILLALRAKAGMTNLFVSAHSTYGRLCLVRLPTSERIGNRYQPASKVSASATFNKQSTFCMVLRKHLGGATLVGIEQPLGERVVDFIFSCADEVGAATHKVLTAEIMGRHSNLIFWDRTSEKILAASHLVTKDMSRQREVAPGLNFARPPAQDKESIFSISPANWQANIAQLKERLTADDTESGAGPPPPTVEQWLISKYIGLGRHLAEEIVDACGLESKLSKDSNFSLIDEKIWQKIEELQKIANYRAYMRLDLTRFSVLGWWQQIDNESEWRPFPSVNDMVEEYFRTLEGREQFQQLKERLRSEIRGECEKLESRVTAAAQHLDAACEPIEFKKQGDLILAHINDIASGQNSLVCSDLLGNGTSEVEIQLNPNLSASQNAQHFYRLFAKHRARQKAASTARQEANLRLTKLREQLEAVDSASEIDQLKPLKERLFSGKTEQRKPVHPESKKSKAKLLSFNSSDGWIIYAGRNRFENDYLLRRMAQPHDVWLHILGLGGAHVLIRVPASKQEPPLTTLKEAAQVAARLSKASSGAKVRVVYTQCRYVKQVDKDKPGLVRYEREKTLEVDTAQPVPEFMQQSLS